MKKPAIRKNADPNLIAKSILDAATGATPEPEPLDPIKEAARTLGRRGGLKGGKARAKKLTKAERQEIAKKAAKSRWGKRLIKQPPKHAKHNRI